MSQINFVYVQFLHCGNKKDPRLREDDNGGVGDDEGKAGKANAKMPGQAGHDSRRGEDDDGKAGMAKLVEPACLRRAQWRVFSCPENPTCRYLASGCFRR